MLINGYLYNIIKKKFPIPCVDLITVNDINQILMLKRKNDPARGQWWFPGGRVHFCEERLNAVGRILKQECGLKAETVKEICTKDLLLNNSDGSKSHAITTIFIVNTMGDVKIDPQSDAFKWDNIDGWVGKDVHVFIKTILTNVKGYLDASQTQ